MASDKHKKATGLFEQSTPLFGSKGSFDEVFPSIEDIKVKVEEIEYKPVVFHCELNKSTMSEYVDCHNPRCYGGGVSIGQIVRDMVRNGETEKEEDKLCKGYEGSAGGQRRDRDCLHLFRVKVAIKYKQNNG